MGNIMILLGSFNEGSQFLLSSKSFREDAMGKIMILLGSFNEGVAISHFSSKSFREDPPHGQNSLI